MAKTLNTVSLLKDHFGTLMAVARAAGVKTHQNVQGWDPSRIPAEYVLPLAKASEWALTPHTLRPDLYPNPTDAMPKRK